MNKQRWYRSELSPIDGATYRIINPDGTVRESSLGLSQAKHVAALLNAELIDGLRAELATEKDDNGTLARLFNASQDDADTLRSQLAEAVALLRTAGVPIDTERCWSLKSSPEHAAAIRAFLARVDKEVKPVKVCDCSETLPGNRYTKTASALTCPRCHIAENPDGSRAGRGFVEPNGRGGNMACVHPWHDGKAGA